MPEDVDARAFATSVELCDRDLAMLAGEYGEAVRLAMRIVVRMAAIQQAARLVDITHVHVGGSIYTGPGSLSAVERLAELGARVRVPTTLNAISVDRLHGMEAGADPELTVAAARLADTLETMGARPTFSCTPYVFPGGPGPGDHILWAESNAIAYANSVIGARTNRHGDFFDICAAVTGRVPLSGLHLPENRVGELLVRVRGVDTGDPSFFTALGYLVGTHAGSAVPVIDGIRGTPSLEALKSFCATVATAGAVGLFHMVGVTPEAPTLAAALGGRDPQRVLDVGLDDLRSVWAQLSTGVGADLQLVVMGSPHATLGDFVELAALVDGRVKHPAVDVLLTTNRLVEEQARERGVLGVVEDFGVRVSTDRCLCMLNEQLLPPGTTGVMTNSGKFAHYGPGLVRRGVYFGSTADCVDSAVVGRAVMGEPAWSSGRTDGRWSGQPRISSGSPTETVPGSTTSA
jgi:predicted aconitase